MLCPAPLAGLRPLTLLPHRLSSISCISSSYSTSSPPSSSSSSIRSSFLDHFSSSGHALLPSSSLSPPSSDETLPFTNAGMNQFKPVLLGAREAPAARCANVQKCARVGGKHNDLELVGMDGSHHTFFEMLGHWSFNDYFKRDACEFAWSYFTGPLGLDPNRLYVTYFSGCETLSIPEDLETKEAWLSLGIAPDRVLPFGPAHNFWEMGARGPCGACAEVHYDHSGAAGAASVNAESGPVVEIGNLVFIDRKRVGASQFEPLETKNVDAGFGLERLAAIKAGSTSNYDSDLFTPLLECIQRETGAPAYSGLFGGADHVDTKYRILADHTRLITTAITDGIYPDSHLKLRNVLRRAMLVAREDFNSDYKLIVELGNYVCDTLGDQYASIPMNLHRLVTVLEFENEQMLQNEERGKKFMPKVIEKHPEAEKIVRPWDAEKIHWALQHIEDKLDEISDGKLNWELGLMIHKLGVNKDIIGAVCELKGIEFDEHEFDLNLAEMKEKIKLGSVSGADLKSLPKTDSSPVHVYTYQDQGRYQFHLVRTKVNGLTNEACKVNVLEEGEHGVVYLEKTSFYAESGGQVGDKGEIVDMANGAIFIVTDTRQVMKSPDHVAHMGYVSKGTMRLDSEVQARIDPMHRILCMQNHTATHLLNEALNEFLPLTCQKSSYVGPDHLRFDFSTFGKEIDVEFVTAVEEYVHKQIASEGKVIKESENKEELFANEDVIAIPGEEYPETVRVIRLPGGGVEPCCGSHVESLSDVQSFAVIESKSECNGVRSFKCFSGEKAAISREKGIELIDEVFKLNDAITKLDDEASGAEINPLLKSIKKTLHRIEKSSEQVHPVPYAVGVEMAKILKEMLPPLLMTSRSHTKSVMKSEFEKRVEEQDSRPFVAAVLEPFQGQSLNLAKVTGGLKDKPFLVVTSDAKNLVARACVPEGFGGDDFGAEEWLDCVARCVGAKAKAPKGQDAARVVNFKVKKREGWEERVKEGMEEAERFASKHLE